MGDVMNAQPKDKYRVFVRNGEDGVHDIADLTELEHLASQYLSVTVKGKRVVGVTFRIIHLNDGAAQ